MTLSNLDASYSARSDDIAISVRNLTKTYRIFGHPGDRIKQAAAFGLRKYHRQFTALGDVSFDIRKGETVGIIGRNGSGKSTLLQLICGILKPTSGTVSVNGRVSALLELGAGFNPEFTGRENVYFQGALIGLAKDEMDARFDDIAAFADIGEFIDQPVRTYSSGMYLRLAFAAMIHVDADILVIDEAIAVGDAGFRERCFRRLGELRAAGCTILIVTHIMEQVNRLCDHAILVDNGQIVMKGSPTPVIEKCLLLQAAGAQQSGAMPSSEVAPIPYAPNGALIEEVHLIDANGQEVCSLHDRGDYRCLFRARLLRPASSVHGAFLIRTRTGIELGGALTPCLNTLSINDIINVELDFKCQLNPGFFMLSVALFSHEGGIEFALHGIQNAIRFEVARELEQPTLGAVNFECHSSIHLTPARRNE